MTAVLKKPASGDADSSTNADTAPAQTSAQPQRRPQAIHTLGELARHAGLDQEPVVRKWQEMIQAALSEQDPERYLQRWNQRRSVSLVAALSLAFWSAIGAAAFGAL